MHFVQLKANDLMVLTALEKKAELEKQVPWSINLFQPKRYKIVHGGRAGVKSWTFARALIIQACLQQDMFVLCARQHLRSLNFSVHRLLANTIKHYKLDRYFTITNNKITNNITNASFIFYGLAVNVENIKGLEALTHVWIEEASDLTMDAWTFLTPTARKQGVEIWASFNPHLVTDVLYDQFVIQKAMPQYSWIHYTTYLDNPWLPQENIAEAEHMKNTNYELYRHVWLGEPKKFDDALVFKTPDHYIVEEFEYNEQAIKYQGIDFGFTDPFACVQLWIEGYDIYVAHEAYAHNLEVDQMGALCEAKIPNFKLNITYADSANPNLISYLKRQGYNVQAVQKGANSVEDGISFLKGFKIHIHPRCVNLINEKRSYSYKRDKKTNEILPILDDKNNHCIDGERYAVEKVRLARAATYKNIKFNQIESLRL